MLNEETIQKILKKYFTYPSAKQTSSFAFLGIGDDAALLPPKKASWVVSSDALEEHIHFDLSYTSPQDLAYKIIAVNLSDMAAMAAEPHYFFLNLSLPKKKIDSKFLTLFFKTLHLELKKYHIQLMGGDSDFNHSTLRISACILGTSKRPLLRSSAQQDDDIWVSGHPGYSALGLDLLRLKNKKYSKIQKKFIQAHLRPQARLKLALSLSQYPEVHSAMDVSDGVLLDLKRLCAASNVGAELEISSLNDTELKDLKMMDDKYLLQKIWTGGEDYELLFTASLLGRKKILKLSKMYNLKLTRIGVIKKNKKILYYLKEKKINSNFFASQGFMHSSL